MKQLKIHILTALFLLTGSTLIAQTPNITEYQEDNPFALRLKISPPYSLFMTNLKSDTFGDEDRSGSGFALGADFVYYFYTKDKVRVNLSLGFGYANYHASREISYVKEISTTDVDGDDVLITETVQRMQEKQKVKFLEIPVKTGLDYTVSEKIDAFCSFGVVYGFKLKSKYENEAIITRTGYYPDYNALVYDVDVDGAPYFYPLNKPMSTEDELATKNNFSLMAEMGFLYKINKKISVMAAVKYIHGLSKVLDVERDPYIIKHDEQYRYSLNSLAARGDKIKTRALGLEFGVQLNVWELWKWKSDQ